MGNTYTQNQDQKNIPQISPEVPTESPMFRKYEPGQEVKTSKIGIDGFSYQKNILLQGKNVEIYINPKGEILYVEALSPGKLRIINKAVKNKFEKGGNNEW